MTPVQRERHWSRELEDAIRHAARCHAGCASDAQALLSLALERLRTAQDQGATGDRRDLQVRAFRGMLSSIALAELVGNTLPVARPQVMALARRLCEAEFPMTPGAALRFLLRANSLQGRMLNTLDKEVSDVELFAIPHMHITAPDGW